MQLSRVSSAMNQQYMPPQQGYYQQQQFQHQNYTPPTPPERIHDISFNGISLDAEQIVDFNDNIPMDVARASLKGNAVDEVILEVDGKKFLAYKDGLNFKGLKKGNIPSTVFDNYLPTVVEAEVNGQSKLIKIHHVDNETNTFWEGAKSLFAITALTQAIPTGIQIAMAPKFVVQGTTFSAKATQFVGNSVTTLGTKFGVGTWGVGLGIGALVLGLGTVGGAIYFSKFRKRDYDALNGLMKK